MAPHRYWRLFFLKNYEYAVAYSLAEVQFRSSIGGSNEIVDASGVFASSQYSEFYGADKAVDGNVATCWVSAVKSGYWGYAFTTPKDIIEVVISARTGGYAYEAPTLMYLQYSDNGIVWITTKLLKPPDLTWEAGQTQVLIEVSSYGLLNIQHTDGTVEQIPITQGSSLDKVVLEYAPRLPFVTSSGRRKTRYAISKLITQIEPCLLMELGASGKMVRKLKVTNYDDRFYANDHDTVEDGTVIPPPPVEITWTMVSCPFVEGQAFRTLANGNFVVSAIGSADPVTGGFTTDQEKPVWTKTPTGSWANTMTHPDWLQGEDVVQNPITGTVCIPMGSGQGYVFRSTDNGATWTQVAFDSLNSLRFIAYGNGTWVAVGDYNTMYVSTDDAATWSKVVGGANGNTAHFSGIVWDGSQFVVYAYNSPTNRVWTTTTPSVSSSWVSHTLSFGTAYITKRAMTWSGTRYVILGNNPNQSGRVAMFASTSVDGPWTQVAPTGQELQSVVYIDYQGGSFVACLASGFAHSTDGLSWTYREMDINWNPISIGKLGDKWYYMDDNWGYWWEGTGL